MAVAIPSPHTIATWKTPTCAPVSTAAHTLPQPKNTSRNVPKNSPVTHFGIAPWFIIDNVCATVHVTADGWQVFFLDINDPHKAIPGSVVAQDRQCAKLNLLYAGGPGSGRRLRMNPEEEHWNE